MSEPAAAQSPVPARSLTFPLIPHSVSREPSSAPSSVAHTTNRRKDDSQPEPCLNDNAPLGAFGSLPKIVGRGFGTRLARDDVRRFLPEDLDLSRLNRIHKHLWMAGRPMRARPLPRYKMMSYTVLITHQMDLPLLRFSNNILVKPLPEWILSMEFHARHIADDKRLQDSATGFLLSYVWLIVTTTDLKFAHEHDLLPKFITWQWWTRFVTEFCEQVDITTLHQVNKRYHYGDLRLDRINLIFRTRFISTHFVRGYLYGHNFTSLSRIFSVFTIFTIILSAMEVGTGLRELENNRAFLGTAYVFVVFSMVSVASVLALVTLLFIITFLVNMIKAASMARRERRVKEKYA